MSHVMHRLLEVIKGSIVLELRPTAHAESYLEGVLAREDLERCVQVLTDNLGPAAKPFDEEPKLQHDLQRMIDRIGGIRRNQCLFLKPLARQTFTYAALWPWTTNPQRVTLKVGTLESSSAAS